MVIELGIRWWHCPRVLDSGKTLTSTIYIPVDLTLYQLAGAPGIGKSTLALQLADMLTSHGNVLYSSGEESVNQVKLRATRLNLSHPSLYLAGENNIDTIVQHIQDASLNIRSAVVDSIQTMYTSDVNATAGSINQVKECTLRLLRLAKASHVPIVLIGHVTKAGDIAGPKVLEHIVDTVLQLEGDAQHQHRIVRCIKNRFGNTNEVGVYSMTNTGLASLINPLTAYLPHVEDLETLSKVGVAITIMMEGSRPIPIEVQALASPMEYGATEFAARTRCRGIAQDRVHMISAVLARHTALSLARNHLFLNVGGGFSISEPAADLSLLLVIASAISGHAVTPGTIVFGEATLAGDLRPVGGTEARLAAAEKLGFTRFILPKGSSTHGFVSNKLQILQAGTIQEALQLGLVK